MSGSVAAAAKGDAREADDVGFPRGQGQQPTAVAADRDRRMGPLEREREDRVAADAIMPAGEGHRFTAQQTLDDRRPPPPAGRPWRRPYRRPTRLARIRIACARRPGRAKPTVRQQIDGRRLARHQHRMAKVVVEHVGAEPQGRRRLGRADQRRHRREEIGKVVGYGQRVVAEGFELAGLLHPFNARARRPDIHAEPERLH